MRQWRIEDLDPPEPKTKRIVDPMETIGLILGAVLVIAVAVAAFGDRATLVAPVPAADASATPAPTAMPVTFVMRSTGMASSGFWCQTTASDRRITTDVPPQNVIIIVMTDRTTADDTSPCVIATIRPGEITPDLSPHMRMDLHE